MNAPASSPAGVIPEALRALVDRANAGDQEALDRLLNPPSRPGRLRPTWEECHSYPDGWRLGRNQLPAALWDAFSEEALTDPAEVAKGVAEAWVMCEYPLLMLEHPLWMRLFDYVGFVSDTGASGHGQERPAPPVLYRSAHPDHLPGMSWTTNIETAYWFASRNRRTGHIASDGIAVVQVETAKCPWWKPLAQFSGRDEDEWVMPWTVRPLPWQVLGFDELDLMSVEWQARA